MLAVDGGDHGDDRREQQERAVALVGFDDHVFAAAQARGGADVIHAAADDERGIEAGRGQHGGGHRGGGGFAVRAGDGDAVFQAHQFGQHFRARNDGNFQPVRFDDFGIVAANGRGDHHDVRAVHVFGLMAFENLRARGCAAAR